VVKLKITENVPHAYLAYGAINARSWETAVDCRWAKLFYVVYKVHTILHYSLW